MDIKGRSRNDLFYDAYRIADFKNDIIIVWFYSKNIYVAGKHCNTIMEVDELNKPRDRPDVFRKI